MTVRKAQVRILLAAEVAYTEAENGKPFQRANATLTAARRNSTQEEIDAAVAVYAASIRPRRRGGR